MWRRAINETEFSITKGMYTQEINIFRVDKNTKEQQEQKESIIWNVTKIKMSFIVNKLKIYLKT